MRKKINKNISLLVIILLIFLLQSCISVSPDSSFNKSKVDRNWSLVGKIGIAYPQSNCSGKKCRRGSDQGGISWQQQKNNFNIILSDPFGRVVLKMIGDDKQVIASKPQGKSFLFDSPNSFLDILIKQKVKNEIITGLSPMDLSYWVMGRANPNYPVKTRGRSFKQKGFTINTSRWHNNYLGDMPHLVTVKRGQLTLRIVIKEWDRIVNY